MTARIQSYLASADLPTPCLVMDLEAIRDNFEALRAALPMASIYYAMKANPAPEIMSMLAEAGSSFDTASIYEIRDALDDFDLDACCRGFRDAVEEVCAA